jgi:hypothetical protein
MTVLKEAFAAVLQRKEIAAAQFAGNLVLLALLYWWFGLSVATIPKVLLVALTAAALLAGSAWLHGAGLAAFAGLDAREAFTRALSRLLRLALITVILLLALLAWDYALGEKSSLDNWLASLLTRLTQKPVSPNSVAWIFPWKLRAWFVLLGLALMPVAAQTVGAIESAKSLLRQPAWWAFGIVLAFTGLYLPYTLIHWVPFQGPLAAELLSAALRFTLAYALAVLSWLLMAALAARLGRPAAS